ncbi:hypothetical protein [Methylopila sp. M107]|uniref:hypothetical protein n=1 Tax=Methylopila sp. M107 TaxID=1101190 RepID=UPI0003628170|nr:hypothetical protein [Methylopila sp. M107]
MIRNYVLAAAVAAGGLAIGAAAPAAAAEAGATGFAKLNVASGDIQNVGWRGRRYGYGRGYYGRGYRRGWGGPRFGIYVAPRPRYYRSYRRCWIDPYGYRVCR